MHTEEKDVKTYGVYHILTHVKIQDDLSVLMQHLPKLYCQKAISRVLIHTITRLPICQNLVVM